MSSYDRSKWFSAADLVKKSSKQIRFLRLKRERIITERMLKGVKYEQRLVEEYQQESDDLICSERRSIFKSNDVIIFACHDMVKNDAVFEIKMIEGDYEDWFLKSSLLQCALYKSIIMEGDGMLYTPTFRKKEGYKPETTQIDKNIDYFLAFGDEKYKVDVLNSKKITEYFVEKAKSTFEYNEASDWDEVHKFKDFDFLSDCFPYCYLGKLWKN